MTVTEDDCTKYLFEKSTDIYPLEIPQGYLSLIDLFEKYRVGPAT